VHVEIDRGGMDEGTHDERRSVGSSIVPLTSRFTVHRDLGG
jgi:hypothetical protein